jgi:hypothetical protein
MAQFQYTGGFGAMPPPLYDMPTHPHHPGYGAEAHPPMSFNSMHPGFSTPTPTQLTFHANMNMNSIPSTPLVVSSTWQQAPVAAPSIPETQFFEPTSYIAQTPISEAPPRLKTEEPTPVSAADSPSDSIGEETPTLSPSSYFWNQMVLPGCNDATGTCQCGDGCECVGCLTHGGHNGVQLDAPAISDDVAFPDFTADAAGLHLDDAAHFLFNPAPT